MKKTIAVFLITFLALPSLAMAWQGKIVAIESADTFVVLKEGETPVKVKLAGIKPASNIAPDKANLDSSNIALMKDVDVRELSRKGELIIGDIRIGEKSLTKVLLDAGIVQSTVLADNPVTPSTEADENTIQQETLDSYSQEKSHKEPSSAEIIAELRAPAVSQQQQSVPSGMAEQQSTSVKSPTIRYVKAPQSQGLGLWPARPSIAAVPVTAEQNYFSQQTSPSVASVKAADNSEMQAPGDIAKKDYELAVRVQQKTRRKKNSGFFVPKNKSETYVGGSIGTQMKSKPSSSVPYSTFGAMGGASVRHFYPSGFGVGGDFTMSRTSGKTGSSGNSTNSTYDYKSKSFDTYTFTGALLYRFYTDPRWTPYLALHGGYSLFSYPDTIFNISDGAPVVGGGAGIMYEFDSGFTIGTDLRYLKTLGTKSHDPDGFFDSTINFGYTFD